MRLKWDWGRAAITVAILSMILALGALVDAKLNDDDNVSQQCYAALQLRLAETPTDERVPIPDEELDRVCAGWERFVVPTTTP